jgi:hypothetical protein
VEIVLEGWFLLCSSKSFCLSASRLRTESSNYTYVCRPLTLKEQVEARLFENIWT